MTSSSRQLVLDILTVIKERCDFQYPNGIPRLIIKDEDKAQISDLITQAIDGPGDHGYTLTMILGVFLQKEFPIKLIPAEPDADTQHFINYIMEREPISPQDISLTTEHICRIIKTNIDSLIDEALPKFTDIEPIPSAKSNTFLMKPPKIRKELLKITESVQDMVQAMGLASWFYLNISREVSHVSYWHLTKALIELAGGKVIVMEEPAADRDLFVRDAALLLKNGIVVTPGSSNPLLLHNPSFKDHCSEYKPILRTLNAMGIVTTRMVSPECFDGGNIIMSGNRVLIRPTRKRADAPGLPVINDPQADVLKVMRFLLDLGYEAIQIQPAKDIPAELYHNDHIVAALPKGEILVCKDMISANSLSNLKTRYRDKLILADVETTMNWGLNLRAATDTAIIMPYCSPELQATLERRGYGILSPQTLGLPAGSLNTKESGAGPDCMTLQITPEFLLGTAKTPESHPLISSVTGSSQRL